MYLREMGTVPLLTREGEVAIAKRIERGKLAVIKSISRTPMVTKKVIQLGEDLKQRAAHDPRAGDVFRRGDHGREDRGPQARGAQADRRGQEGARGWCRRPKRSSRPCRRRRSGSTAARAGRCCEARVELSPADPRDRVHRAGEAPDDRRDQGAGRGRPAHRARDDARRAAARPAEGQQAAEAARGREEALPEADQGSEGRR